MSALSGVEMKQFLRKEVLTKTGSVDPGMDNESILRKSPTHLAEQRELPLSFASYRGGVALTLKETRGFLFGCDIVEKRSEFSNGEWHFGGRWTVVEALRCPCILSFKRGSVRVCPGLDFTPHLCIML